MKKNITTGNDKTNIKIQVVALVVSVVAIIVTIVVSYKSCNSNEEIARKSRAFDKPYIALAFGNYEVPHTSDDDTIKIIYSGALPDSSYNISSFPFQINNRGQKNAENIKLVIEYPKISSLAIMDSNLVTSTGPPIGEFKRNFVSQKDINLIIYQVDQINPGLSITISEPFRLHKSEFTTKINLNDSLSYALDVKYATFFSVALLAKDLQTQKVNFSYQCVDSQSIDELIKDYVKSIVRKINSRNSQFFVVPEKSNIAAQGNRSVNDYYVCKQCVFMVYIEDLSPNQDMIVAVYDGQNKLRKIKVFNEKNEFVKDVAYP